MILQGVTRFLTEFVLGFVSGVAEARERDPDAADGQARQGDGAQAQTGGGAGPAQNAKATAQRPRRWPHPTKYTYFFYLVLPSYSWFISVLPISFRFT